MVKFIGKMVLLATILVTLPACNLTDRIRSSALTSVDAGSVLFYDDFSDAQSGWTTITSDKAEIYYDQAGLRFKINATNYDYWSSPGLRFSDVTIAVDAKMLGGPEDNDFGIICRFQDQFNFYALLISSDGYGGIVKVKDGLYTVLNNSDGLEYGTMIRTGSDINQIRADCINNQLSLYVNHEPFMSVEDGDFTIGEVGLIAGSYSQSGVDILFDNYFVIKP
jgi:hypothetical protein